MIALLQCDLFIFVIVDSFFFSFEERVSFGFWFQRDKVHYDREGITIETGSWMITSLLHIEDRTGSR